MNSNSKNSVDYNLLAKYFAGDASNQEAQEIDVWRSISEQNEIEFQELQLVWLDTGILIKPDTEELKIDLDSAWDSLNKKMDIEVREIDSKEKTISSRKFYNIAAALAIILLSYFVFNLVFGDSGQSKLAASNEVLTEKLLDGTVVTLNEESTLTYSEQNSENIRQVELDGEAFFEVERDTLKPFVIHAGEAMVTVLGTSFNVDAFSDENFVTVSVETGKVKLSFGESESILMPGMVGIIDKTSGTINVNAESEGNEDAWRDNNLVFRRTKLKNVVNTLNDLYDANIELGSEEIAGCRLSAKFNDETLENIIDIIVSTFELEITRIDDKIILNGDAC